MKRVVVYGGAFNPPTVAHQSILQECLVYARENDAEMVLLPSGERDDKTIGVPTHDRLALIRALLESVDSRDVSTNIETIELYDVQNTQTYQTYKKLALKYPEFEQIWVFGSDSIQTLQNWEYGEWMYANMQMLVIPRPDYELEALPPRAKWLRVDAPHVSSTLVREHRNENMDFRHLVPPQVYKVLTQL